MTFELAVCTLRGESPSAGSVASTIAVFVDGVESIRGDPIRKYSDYAYQDTDSNRRALERRNGNFAPLPL